MFVSSLFLALLTALPGLARADGPGPLPSPTPPILHPLRDRRYEPVGKAVEHTDVKDQGGVGFCWSYAAIGRLESEYLRATGRRVDLSEEYVGFFHIYEQLLEMSPTFFTTMEKHPGKGGLLVSLLVSLIFHPSEGAPDLRLADRLIDKYGVVPEQAFSYKVKGGLFGSTIQGRVRRFINQVMRDPAKNRDLRLLDRDGNLTSKPDPQKLLEALAKVYTLETDRDPPRPAGSPCRSCELLDAIRGFDFDGVRLTPQKFAQETIGFSAKNYEQVVVNASNHAAALARLDRELAAGRPVEIALTLFDGFPEAHRSGILSPESCGERKACEPAGGHALLVINRVIDPRTGKTSGYVLKNSWGAKEGRDENGETSGGLGFDILTPDYLTELYAKAKIAKASDRSWFLLFRKP